MSLKQVNLVVISLLLLSVSCISYSQVPQNERDALVMLYNATGGENWTGANPPDDLSMSTQVDQMQGHCDGSTPSICVADVLCRVFVRQTSSDQERWQVGL